MITIDIEQGTQEWKDLRVGVPSASNFDKIVTMKGEPSKQAEKYIYELAGERITGVREEGYLNANMQRGMELEAKAREVYELITDLDVSQVGLCYPNEDKKYSCSPDGLVGDDGLIEIKCPIITTQVDYLLSKKFPSTYFQQVQGQLLVTGRKWCDFVSYYPGLKPLITRVERDEKFIEALASELEVFCSKIDEVVKEII